MDVHVEHATGVRWRCPTCGRGLACRDHAEQRIWRHLDNCQFKTFLHAWVPRVECPGHGVLQVKASWAEAIGRFTLLMERLIVACYASAPPYPAPVGSCGSVGMRL